MEVDHLRMRYQQHGMRYQKNLKKSNNVESFEKLLKTHFSRQYMENYIFDCFIYSFTFIKYYSDDMLYNRVTFILNISFWVLEFNFLNKH